MLEADDVATAPDKEDSAYEEELMSSDLPRCSDLQPHGHAKRQKIEEFRHGPSDLRSLLLMPQALAAAVVSAIRGIVPDFQEFRCSKWQKVRVTTSYSGMGIPEEAVAAIRWHLRQLGVTLEVEFYSACEMSETCRQALGSKRDSTRAQHIFGNLLDRLPPQVQQELQQMFTAAREAISMEIVAVKQQSGPQAARAAHRALLQERASKIWHAASSLLATVGFSSHAAGLIYCSLFMWSGQSLELCE
jgi:hypothetical protein